MPLLILKQLYEFFLTNFFRWILIFRKLFFDFNLLAIARFRIGVPSILFSVKLMLKSQKQHWNVLQSSMARYLSRSTFFASPDIYLISLYWHSLTFPVHTNYLPYLVNVVKECPLRQWFRILLFFSEKSNVYLFGRMHITQTKSIILFLLLLTGRKIEEHCLRGHSITTWTRWGGEGVKKCLFLSTLRV